MSEPQGYIDLQVNGYAGIDFNADNLQTQDLEIVCQKLANCGVSTFLATIITGPLEAMRHRISNLVCRRQESELATQMIAGIHLEGPFINPKPGFVGAHDPNFVVPASMSVVQPIIEIGQGLIRMVTLAPEYDKAFMVTDWLARQNIAVSAGHTDASLGELAAAIDHGLSMFTHLGNGCPIMLPRHDNIIQRVLSLSDKLLVTMILDGQHVPLFVVRNFLRTFGPRKVILISDVTAAGGLGPGNYRLGSVDVAVGLDGVARLKNQPEYLAGSTITLADSAELCEHNLHLTPNDIGKLTRQNALPVLGMESPKLS